MSKDALERLTDTLDYIDHIPNISPNHAARLRTAKAADVAASARISLGGGIRPFPSDRETQRRRALRALLLCLDWSGDSNQIGDAKKHYHNSPEADIQDAVKSFFPLVTSTEQTVANTAATFRPKIGRNNDFDHAIYKFRRGAVVAGDPEIGGNCYSAVAIWLYLDGAVSLRWLKQYGEQPEFRLPAWAYWGAPITTPAGAATIPSGQVCRLEKPQQYGGGLHYVITIGVGQCAGVNNSVDICLHWNGATYGVAPTTECSQFPIAGYLATMLVDCPGSFIKTASCLPNLGHLS